MNSPLYPLTWARCVRCGLVNVDPDIPDETLFRHYRYSSSTVPALVRHHAQFAAFLSGVREGGPIVVCGDDPKLVEVARGTGRTVTTYGLSEDCDARILATEAQGVGTRFTLRLPAP